MTVYEIQIGYKSGNKQVLWFESFEITGTSCEWKLYNKNEKSIIKILKLGIDDIEYVTQISTKEVK